MIKFALKDLIEVGYIHKTFGTKGELQISLVDGLEDSFAKINYFFVKQSGQAVPYFVESRDEELLTLTFEDIDNPEDATHLCNKAILLDQEFLASTNVFNRAHNLPLQGFTLFNDGINCGLIKEIIEMPAQNMITLQDYSAAMIPLVEDWIKEVDMAGKIIKMSFDPALLEINV